MQNIIINVCEVSLRSVEKWQSLRE